MKPTIKTSVYHRPIDYTTQEELFSKVVVLQEDMQSTYNRIFAPKDPNEVLVPQFLLPEYSLEITAGEIAEITFGLSPNHDQVDSFNLVATPTNPDSTTGTLVDKTINFDTFNTPGVFTYTLTATNATGSTETTISILVNEVVESGEPEVEGASIMSMEDEEILEEEVSSKTTKK